MADLRKAARSRECQVRIPGVCNGNPETSVLAHIRLPNDELFGIIYTVDEGDDWTNPQVLEKANATLNTRPTVYAITTTSRTTITATATCLDAGSVGATVTRSSDDTACYGRYFAIGC